MRLPDDFHGCELKDNQVTEPLSEFTPTTISPTTSNGDTAYESKLWNSEFYQRCYIYGDDQWTLKYENFYTSNFPTSMSIYFTPSKDMTNDFRWEFDLGDDRYRREDSYSEYMFTSVSTQLPQYNSSYIDYIRNGYNYDQWANKKQNQLAVINAVGSIASGVVQVGTQVFGGVANYKRGVQSAQAVYDQAINAQNSFIGDPLLEDYYFNKDTGEFRSNKTAAKWVNRWNETQKGIDTAYGQLQQARSSKWSSFANLGSLVAGQAINSITSGINSALSIESNNRSYRNMVNSKAAASVTTTGNSNVRLRPYSRLATIDKTIPDEERTNVYWVFYYTGYAHPVQEKPNWSSRYWFNYVSCRAVFNDENVQVYSDYLDEIKQRFELGITVYHMHNGNWDINQQYENGEVFLYA